MLLNDRSIRKKAGDWMLEIGVLSDSHAYALNDLPKKAVDLLGRMDLIVHAGDYTGTRLLEELRALGEFKGVHGNMDPPEIKEVLSRREIFELRGFKIGVTHPWDGGAPLRLESRVRRQFEQVDVIVYGHSHWTKNEVSNGILYFNPGSVTGRFPARHKTLGVLTIEKDVVGKIITL